MKKLVVAIKVLVLGFLLTIITSFLPLAYSDTTVIGFPFPFYTVNMLGVTCRVIDGKAICPQGMVAKPGYNYRNLVLNFIVWIFVAVATWFVLMKSRRDKLNKTKS
jgi:hypothetical protein